MATKIQYYGQEVEPLFEAEYDGHIVQVDTDSKTYYAHGKEAFVNEGKCVTHGGTHLLEVLIPFITLE